MFVKKLKKAIGSIVSSILLCVTFGVFSSSKAAANVVPTLPAAQTETSESEMLDTLKGNVKADYRANIDSYESHDHTGHSGPVG